MKRPPNEGHHVLTTVEFENAHDVCLDDLYVTGTRAEALDAAVEAIVGYLGHTVARSRVEKGVHIFDDRQWADSREAPCVAESRYA